MIGQVLLVALVYAVVLFSVINWVMKDIRN